MLTLPTPRAVKGGEGEAQGHEDQLNSDCTTGERRTINNPNHPALQPLARENARYQAPDTAPRVPVHLIVALSAGLWFGKVL